MLTEAVERVRSLTAIDMRNKSIWEVLGSTGEEFGEVNRELLIEEASYGNRHKKGGGEGSRTESVDLTICALALYFARGGTTEELACIMMSKLDKWERNQKDNDSRRNRQKRVRRKPASPPKSKVRVQPRPKRALRAKRVR